MAKEAPPRNAGTVNNSLLPLHELLVRTQQSLAKAVESANEAVKSEVSFSIGERPMYVIEGIDFDLAAGINGGPDRSLQLDFEAPSESRSRLKFRVVRKPMEVARGRQLVLSNLDPLGLNRPHVRLRILFFENNDGEERVLSEETLLLKIAESGDADVPTAIELTTDVQGRVEVLLDLNRGELEIMSSSAPVHRLKLRFRSECYIWAEEKEKTNAGTSEAGRSSQPLRSKVLILPIRNYAQAARDRRE